MIKIGIIGYGKMGKIRAKAIRENGGGTICAVYDPQCDPGEDGLPRAESPEAVIADPEVEAVFICTPNYLNKALTIAALQAGKHVFCEKPPAFCAQDIREIRTVEMESTKKLMYGFNHRHHGSIKKAKELIDSGEFGHLLWMRGRYGKNVDANFFDTWRAKKELAGGGILLDQGIHMLDLFLHFANDFDVVQAIVQNRYWALDIEDNVFANFLNTKTGVAASLHSTMLQWRHLFSLEVFMEKGHLVINGLKTPSGAYGDEVLTVERNLSQPPEARWDEPQSFSYPTDSSWNSEIAAFFHALQSGKRVEYGSSTDALKLMTLIDRVYQSGVKTGQTT
ncbi:MAG: Gfo/Idh/MocA family oxidoreductase [Kiritimatiellae bacterium]|nr:Gfo/Idh/MocA family oxidoreductase [Kiritimatiellia bacterium]